MEAVQRRLAAAVLCALAGLVLSSQARAEEDEPAATPFRPTVTSGANISLPGWLELELGGQRLGGHDFERRNTLPYLLKYSLNEQWALLVGGDARVRSTDAGGLNRSGAGDTSLTLKFRGNGVPEGHSYGFEASIKFPTAASGLGSGERDYSLKGIYGIDLPEGFHLDTNLMASKVGGVPAGQGQYQTLWAAAVSHPVGDAWTLALDLSGTRQAGLPSTSQLLGAASYAVNKRLVLDAGLAAGLNSNSPKWTAFCGLTVLMGQLN